MPRGKAGEVPNDLEQATGLEREELLATLEGKDIFVIGKSRHYYGTKTRPAFVDLHYEERIVGCSGYPMESHEMRWFKLKKDQPRRCSECGQYFKLRSVEGAH